MIEREKLREIAQREYSLERDIVDQVINKINQSHLNLLLIKDLGFAAKKKLKLSLNFYLKIIPK